MSSHDFDNQRNRMVDEQLIFRDIKSEAVLDAMRTVPRHLFVPKDMQHLAYNDCALPIRLRQTISQPYIVAFMTEQLQYINSGSGQDLIAERESFQKMKILEIGTGSGYQTAILAHLGCDVCTIEVFKELSESAEQILEKLNYTNVNFKIGNGYDGWPEEAPFDAIIVTAAPESIPKKLIEQLKNGTESAIPAYAGKMIVPVGQENSVQMLKLIIKNNNTITERDLFPVKFVPMRDYDS